MPKEIDGVTYFTQEELNQHQGTARTEGRTSGEKTLLKTLGFEKAEDATTFVTKAKETANAGKTETERLQAEAATAKAQAAETATRLRAVTLESKAVDAGAKHGLTVPKAKQVLRLIDVPADFDLDKGTLEDTFKTFLEKPENAHFKSEPVTAPAAGARKPGDTTPAAGEKKDKLGTLLDRFQF